MSGHAGEVRGRSVTEGHGENKDLVGVSASVSYKRRRKTGAARKTVDSCQRGEREGEAVKEDEPDEESCFLASNRRVADMAEGSGRPRWTRDIVTHATPEGSTIEPPPPNLRRLKWVPKWARAEAWAMFAVKRGSVT